MGALAYAIHRLVEVRLGPRLKRGLTRLAGAAAKADTGSGARPA
jgi:hypothetical protein